jgi:outer membrane protein OmpA-like peptidoglycan-associated protein
MKRNVIGLGALVLGIAVLGLWGTWGFAPQIEGKLRSAAETALTDLGAQSDLTLTVSGRDIAIAGLALNTGGAAAVVAALNDVAGRRVVRTDLQDLPVAAPYVLTARKDGTAADGAITAEGVVPNDATRASLAPILGDAAQGLTLAAGMPEDWDANAVAGVTALSLLQKGKLSVEGQTVVLSGEVITQGEMAAVDAALGNVKLLVKDITVLDDGLPVAYTLNYSASAGGVLDGKLPFGVTPNAFALGLGLPSIGGTAKTALIREMGDISYLSAWAAVLPQIETLFAEVTPDGRNVRAKLIEGADADAIRAALATGGFTANVELPPPPAPKPEPVPEPAPAPSETPILDQMLPAMSPLGFEITPSGCQGASDALLAKTTIIFLPNSDALDESATAVLTDLAAIARDCAGGALRAEIGGHTDTSGDEDENLALSARRAEAVRAALIAAGVPGAQLSAKGYGSAQPISENETKEGRVKNRRTTVVWGQN